MLEQHLSSNRKIAYGDATKALSTAREMLDIHGKLESGYAGTKAALGQIYRGEKTEWESAVARIDWLTQVLDNLGQLRLSDQLCELVQRTDHLFQWAKGAKERLSEGLSKVTGRVSTI
jgi:hypothetical protein